MIQCSTTKKCIQRRLKGLDDINGIDIPPNSVWIYLCSLSALPLPHPCLRRLDKALDLDPEYLMVPKNTTERAESEEKRNTMPALPTKTRIRSDEDIQPTMTSIPTRSAKRKQADSQTAETNSETSRTSKNDAIFSDNDSLSQATNQTDVDSDSDLSTSSEDPSSESDDDDDGSDSDNESDTTDRALTQDSEAITDLRPGTKPNMKLGALKGGLLQRLKTFIPELAAANQELDKERLNGTIERRNIERVDEGDGPFIELVSGQDISSVIMLSQSLIILCRT